MKALVGAFNQEKALVGAFSVIVQPVVEPMDHYTALPGTHQYLIRLCILLNVVTVVMVTFIHYFFTNILNINININKVIHSVDHYY